MASSCPGGTEQHRSVLKQVQTTAMRRSQAPDSQTSDQRLQLSGDCALRGIMHRGDKESKSGRAVDKTRNALLELPNVLREILDFFRSQGALKWRHVVLALGYNPGRLGK